MVHLKIWFTYHVNDKETKERAIFVVGLLAAFLALSPYQNLFLDLNLNIFGNSKPFLGFVLAFICLLTLSVYFYALDYFRYSLDEYQNLKILKLPLFLADFFYAVAIFFPIAVSVAVILSLEFFTSMLGKVDSYFVTLTSWSLLATFLAGVSLSSAVRKYKNRKEEYISMLEQMRLFSLQKSLQLFDKGFYGESLIESQKVLEQYIRERLFDEKDYTTRNIPMRKLVELSFKNKIVDEKYRSAILDLIGLRNKAAHSSVEVEERSARFALELVKSVLESIDIESSENFTRS